MSVKIEQKFTVFQVLHRHYPGIMHRFTRSNSIRKARFLLENLVQSKLLRQAQHLSILLNYCLKLEGKNTPFSGYLYYPFSSQSVQPLASIQRKTSERLHCECDSCEEIRHAKLYVSREKLPKSASEKFADPLEDTTEAFINRIKVLKQYDLETARQEQTYVLFRIIFYHVFIILFREVKRKKKKKQ